MKLVYEVNGSDVGKFEEENGLFLENANGLLFWAKHISEENGVPLSDVTLRFVEG